ncbi:MAG: hypothetical protein K8I00_06705 [Candidatus Omnitrophica bacterium]|nr:hypothetical protein [Candidatus Omnitrophota bacterium]
MKYECGTQAMLGDEIMVSYGPNKKALGRVVAIGLDLVKEDIDKVFWAWAKKDNIINDQTVVIEWIKENPLAHDNPQHAPIGNYMTLSSVCCEEFVKRAPTS